LFAFYRRLDHLQNDVARCVENDVIDSLRPNTMQNTSNFGYLLVDVSRLFLKRFAREAARVGFTLLESKTLGYLARHEGISQARLADLCDLEPMALARILGRMEKDGWVERRSDPRDRRAKRLYLTLQGEQILAELAKIGADLREHLMAKISLRDQENLVRVLDHLYEQLSQTECSGEPERSARENEKECDQVVHVPLKRASRQTGRSVRRRSS
jgi:DNA-binding MarR family transcriptional regulator